MTGCKNITDDNSKKNDPNKTDNPDTIDRNEDPDGYYKNLLKKFNVDIDDNQAFPENRPEKADDWEPLEGEFEVEDLSGPLTDSQLQAGKMCEIYLCGATSQGTNCDDLIYLDSTSSSVKSIQKFTANTYMKDTIIKTAAYDINEDGFEEILIASFSKTNSEVTIYEKEKQSDGNYAETVLFSFQNENLSSITTNSDKQGDDSCDFCLGDIDGDGKKEFIIAFAWKDNAICKFFDDIDAGFAEIASKDYKKGSYIKIASDNFDGTDADEIAVAWGYNNKRSLGSYEILKYVNGQLSASSYGNMKADGFGDYAKIAMADIACCDVNNDTYVDIIFGGQQNWSDASTDTHAIVLVLGYNDSIKDYEWIGGTWNNAINCNKCAYQSVAAGDVNGDGMNEIVFGNRVFQYDSTSGQRFKQISNKLASDGGAGVDGLAIADVDYDGINEIIQVTWSGKQVDIQKLKADGSVSTTSMAITPCSSCNATVAICTPATVKGLARFKYIGHSLKFTNPMPIALLAAPLYYTSEYADGIDEEELQPAWGSQETSIGKSKSTTHGENGSFSTGISTSFGLKKGSDDALAVKVGLSIGAYYEKEWGTEKTTTVSKSFSSYEENSVVVEITPIDVYEYEVINFPSSDKLKGDVLEISLPRPQILGIFTAEYYDANRDSNYKPISQLFTNTPGNPKSYNSYTKTQQIIENTSTAGSSKVISKDAIKHPRILPKQDDLLACPQGNNSATLELSKETVDSVSRGFSIETSIDVEVESKVGYAGGSLCFNGGRSWSTDIGTETAISGTVGGLASDYYSEYKYKWGIAAYPINVPLTDTETYSVPLVTYIVENF